MTHRTLLSGAAAAAALAFSAAPAQAQFFHIGDGSIDGSLCVGFDCVANETFSFDTIRLKENNLRIKFMDTSTVNAFPPNDWQLRANSSANGGLNAFFIDDMGTNNTTGQVPESTPFTIEANAGNNAFYIDDAERIGLSTSTPVVELHIVDGDTPTVRLEQDNTNGFEPQTWDVAGNETNFFVRDVTGGSQLPFRIRPGADSNALFIDVDNDVGMGTSTPDFALDVTRTGAGAAVIAVLQSTNTSSPGATQLRLHSDQLNNRRIVGATAGNTVQTQIALHDDDIRLFGTDFNNPWLEVSAAGISVNGTQMNVPDYVFADDYALMPLDELAAFIAEHRHLPAVPSASEVNSGSLNMTKMQLSLLEKVEELTLYTIAQQKMIDALQAELAAR